jgi:hypothetical protein
VYGNSRDAEILIKMLLEQNTSLQQKVLALKQEIARLEEKPCRYGHLKNSSNSSLPPFQ